MFKALSQREGSAGRTGQKLLFIVLAGLPVGLLITFFYLPLGRLLSQGFTKRGLPTLSYIRQIVTDHYYLEIIGFTAKQAVYSVLLSIGIGFPGAWLLSKFEFKGRKILKSLTLVPFVLPPITVVTGFITFFGYSGVINSFLMNILSLNEPPLKILYSLPGIVLAHAFYNAPIITRMVTAQWEQIGPAYSESAQSLGATPFRRFIDITLPLLVPGLATGSALAFIFSFLSFPIVLTLGGIRFSTIEVEIYSLVHALGEYKLAAALSAIEVLLSLSFTYLYIRLQGWFSVELSSYRQRRRYSLTEGTRHLHQKILAWAVIIGGVILFIGPLGSIFYQSLSTADKGLSLYWYRQLLSPRYQSIIGSAPVDAIVNSLIFGGATAILGGVIGLPASYMISSKSTPGGKIIDTLLMAPLGISSVALGLALFQSFSTGPLSSFPRWLAIIFAHSTLAYPFFIRAITPQLERMPEELVETARSLGAGPTKAFTDITLPLIAPGVSMGALFAFAISMGEMSATIMLVRPGLKTIPVVIYELVGARKLGQAAALSAGLIILVSIAFVLIERGGERLYAAALTGEEKPTKTNLQ